MKIRLVCQHNDPGCCDTCKQELIKEYMEISQLVDFHYTWGRDG